jgi:peptidase M1-like protein
MKLCSLRLCLLCVLCTSVVNALSLDREAFTFTSYDLNVRVEPEQQRLGVRGKIILRNDSQTPQKIAVLQISSSLNWRSINAGGKPLQFVAQPYTSDIDHTGELSEAIVTLPQAVAPKATIELEIGYEGVIVLDATRLTRIGAPEDAARSADWDQISTKFTAVRGAGNVAWYPIATEAGNLSEGNSEFEAMGRWKTRETTSTMHLQIAVPSDDENEKPELLVNATTCPSALGVRHQFVADCSYRTLGSVAPTFVMADYEVAERADIAVHYLHGHDVAAAAYADAAEKVTPLITDWFGSPRNKAQTADLDDPNAAPFESGSLLLIPLANADSKAAGLMAAHQLTHAALSSPRPWINEGLAHFAQALFVEHQSGRQAALDYMTTHRVAFSAAENEKGRPTTAPRSEDEVNRSLVNTADEELYRSKAMCAWWMLRDMVGDQALKKALASYHPEQDREPSYMQKLIQAQSQKDLEWFFDDWVYRDRGLPDFKVESAFSRKSMNDVYLLTVTVDNLGQAGAEVPITVKFAGGEVMKRVEVRGNSKGVIRVETAKAPEEIVVNDGSVPESDTTNNAFKIEAGETGDPDK